ncbi:MAG: hypothetical protein Q9227_009475 [Pyrenula ochraceoflavens]
MNSNTYFQIPSSRWRSISGGRNVGQSTRKRKRKEFEDKDQSHGSFSEPLDSIDNPNSSQHVSAKSHEIPILTPDDIAQYKVAGQPALDPLPVAPFPHKDTSLQAQELRLQASHRPQHTTPESGSTRTPHLRLQHLSVLTTVLHRCILQRDFSRARRALGLIIRHNIGGHRFDFRSGALWGLGAEILLRIDQQLDHCLPKLFQDEDSEHERIGAVPTIPTRPAITRQNLETTKRFLESLSVQYAYHKSHPRIVSAVDFKLASIQLWIYVLQLAAKSVYQAQLLEPDDVNDMFVPNRLTDGIYSEEERSDRLADVVEEVRQVSREFETLMQAPTYSNRLEFLKLQAMVTQWKGDLCHDLSSRRMCTAEPHMPDESPADVLAQEAIQSHNLAAEMWDRISELPRQDG